jgi:ribonuclease G
MHKELIINVEEGETRVALLEDGNLAELFIERGKDADITGNIYKGRVQRVLPGIQAAFIDIGLKQAAFIYVDDVLRPGDTNCRVNRLVDEENGRESGIVDEDEFPLGGGCPIEELLREGQEIMVHVAKAPIGTKGPRVTAYVSLPGRFLVLMPFANHIGVSRRIEDESERLRLREVVSRLRSHALGYIVRTAAEGLEEKPLANEMQFLENLWENIQKEFAPAPVPSLVHQELSLCLRAVRDLLIHEVDRLVIDSSREHQNILAFLDSFMPSLKSRVNHYDGQEPIFDAYNLEADISRALKRKVWLKSGGYIVIEQTEALVAIDVNTGRYVGKHNLEETILKTNLEAVKEIAYQIRLRDLGGLIIIDFIDMQKKSNQEKVYNALTEALKKDRSKTHVLPISDMGLVQMTRKRSRKPLTRMLCEPCFYCDGEGYLISRQSVCYSIYREILRDHQELAGQRIDIKVNPEVAERLHGEESHLVNALERSISKRIVIYPEHRFHLEQFEIVNVVT